MNFEHIHRAQVKADLRAHLRHAQVSAKSMTALYLALGTVLSLVNYAGSTRGGPVALFLDVLTMLIAQVLGAGFVLYCMAILRGERAEYLILFDGFSIAGKFVALYLVKTAFIALWSMLFFFPGIIAAYRYRFAEYNLLENPDLGIFEAMDLSKRQTFGYKLQLFSLDMSYLGWELLALLPALIETTLYSYDASAAMLGLPTVMPVVAPWMYAVWIAFAGVWQLAVSLFYLPHLQCARLAYYDVAKRTSGLDPAQIKAPTPDGL